MQRFLQFRLVCHGLPIATDWLAGAGHVDRANRVCLVCNPGAICDEEHMIFECTALQLAPLRQQHADLFKPRTDTMGSFFRSAGPSGGFGLRYNFGWPKLVKFFFFHTVRFDLLIDE